MQDAAHFVDLYWLPLGAGGHIVRFNGRAYEALMARRDRRPSQDLYHAALIVQGTRGRHTIELGPALGIGKQPRGVVLRGPVGVRWGMLTPALTYEVRVWRDGVIPDLAYAVDSPVRLTNDPATADRLIDLVPTVPPLTWGRDERGTGDMWNSNSLVSWLLVRAGIDTSTLQPPRGGRAPGWDAGLALARAREPAGVS